MAPSFASRSFRLLMLAMVLSLSGCGQSAIDLGNDQVGIRLPDRYLIKADLADTAAERELGLSGRTSLAADAGMWFVFDQVGSYPFWMPDMNFAIDIIWADSTFGVVKVASNVLPEPGVSRSQLKLYTNQLPALYVLEIPAGTAAAHHLGVGDKLKLIP